MGKRKIYRLILYLYGDGAKIEIDEFCIRRKGAESISTEEGETLYAYMLNKPLSGVVIGENSIEVEMITEDFQKIDKAIDLMIEEGRKRVSQEIEYLNGMYTQLSQLESIEKEIFFKAKEKGFCFIEKDKSELIVKPFNKDIKPYSIHNHNQ